MHSETGTTQQGFNLNAGSPTSHFYFSARVDKVDGGNAVTCPLLYGIQTNRKYFTFRLQALPDGGLEAVSYQIIPKGTAVTSGFYGVLVDQTGPLPYVDHWNIIHPSERTKSELAIEGDGNFYRFFVNGRQVFARQIDTVPTHTVAVGTTVLANDLKSDAVCQYDKLTLKVAS